MKITVNLSETKRPAPKKQCPYCGETASVTFWEGHDDILHCMACEGYFAYMAFKD